MKLALLGLLAAVVVGAPAPGGVAPAAPMTTPRSTHTATLLPDGRVLIVGGLEGEDSAELFDPQSGRWTRTGSPLASRVAQTATLLLDGRVLIAGGWTREGGDLLRSAELYDPTTGTFARTGSMTTGRGGFTATRLHDGRVLVAGGSANGRVLATAELYDPRTGRFARTGRMAVARAVHAATLLAGGRVLVSGGAFASGAVAAGAEVFDPRAGRFRRTGAMTVRRYKHAAVTLPNGRVLVVGGSNERDGHGRYASAELYDPGAGRFARAGSMTAPRFKLTDAVVRLRDGRVLVAGDGDQAEVYDPARRTFAAVPGRLDAGMFVTATLLRDGRVLVAGGYDEEIRSTARAWLVSP